MQSKNNTNHGLFIEMRAKTVKSPPIERISSLDTGRPPTMIFNSRGKVARKPFGSNFIEVENENGNLRWRPLSENLGQLSGNNGNDRGKHMNGNVNTSGDNSTVLSGTPTVNSALPLRRPAPSPPGSRIRTSLSSSLQSIHITKSGDPDITAVSTPPPLIPAPKTFLERQSSLSSSVPSLSSPKLGSQKALSPPPQPPVQPTPSLLPLPPDADKLQVSSYTYVDHQLYSVASSGKTTRAPEPPLNYSTSHSPSTPPFPPPPPLSPLLQMSPSSSSPASSPSSASSSPLNRFRFPPPPTTPPPPLEHSQNTASFTNISVSSPVLLSPGPDNVEHIPRPISPTEVMEYFDEAIGDQTFSVSSYHDSLGYPEFSPAFHFLSVSDDTLPESIPPVIGITDEPAGITEIAEESKKTSPDVHHSNSEIIEDINFTHRTEMSELSPKSEEDRKRRGHISPKNVAVSKLRSDVKTVRQHIKPGTVDELASLFTNMKDEHITSGVNKEEFDFDIRETKGKLGRLDKTSETKSPVFKGSKGIGLLSPSELFRKMQGSVSAENLNERATSRHSLSYSKVNQSPRLYPTSSASSVYTPSILNDPKTTPGFDFLSASREMYKHVVLIRSNSRSESFKRVSKADNLGNDYIGSTSIIENRNEDSHEKNLELKENTATTSDKAVETTNTPTAIISVSQSSRRNSSLPDSFSMHGESETGKVDSVMIALESQHKPPITPTNSENSSRRNSQDEKINAADVSGYSLTKAVKSKLASSVTTPTNSKNGSRTNSQERKQDLEETHSYHMALQDALFSTGTASSRISNNSSRSGSMRNNSYHDDMEYETRPMASESSSTSSASTPGGSKSSSRTGSMKRTDIADDKNDDDDTILTKNFLSSEVPTNISQSNGIQVSSTEMASELPEPVDDAATHSTSSVSISASGEYITQEKWNVESNELEKENTDITRPLINNAVTNSSLAGDLDTYGKSEGNSAGNNMLAIDHKMSIDKLTISLETPIVLETKSETFNKPLKENDTDYMKTDSPRSSGSSSRTGSLKSNTIKEDTRNDITMTGSKRASRSSVESPGSSRSSSRSGSWTLKHANKSDDDDKDIPGNTPLQEALASIGHSSRSSSRSGSSKMSSKSDDIDEDDHVIAGGSSNVSLVPSPSRSRSSSREGSPKRIGKSDVDNNYSHSDVLETTLTSGTQVIDSPTSKSARSSTRSSSSSIIKEESVIKNRKDDEKIDYDERAYNQDIANSAGFGDIIFANSVKNNDLQNSWKIRSHSGERTESLVAAVEDIITPTIRDIAPHRDWEYSLNNTDVPEELKADSSISSDTTPINSRRNSRVESPVRERKHDGDEAYSPFTTTDKADASSLTVTASSSTDISSSSLLKNEIASDDHRTSSNQLLLEETVESTRVDSPDKNNRRSSQTGAGSIRRKSNSSDSSSSSQSPDNSRHSSRSCSPRRSINLDDSIAYYYNQTSATATATTAEGNLPSVSDTDNIQPVLTNRYSKSPCSRPSSRGSSAASRTGSPKSTRNLDDVITDYYNQTSMPATSSTIKDDGLASSSDRYSPETGYIEQSSKSRDSSSSSRSPSPDNSRHSSLSGSPKRSTNLDDVINDYYNKSLITATTTTITTATTTKDEVVAVSGRHSPQTGFKSNSSSSSSRSTSPDNSRHTSRPESPKRSTNLDDVINNYYNKSLITATTTATTTTTATKDEVVAVSGRHSPQTGFVKSNSSSNSSRSTSPDNNRDTSRPESPKRSTNLDDVINDYYNKSLITATTTATTTATATKDEVVAVSGRHSPQTGFVKSNSSSSSSRSTSPDNNRDTSRPESPKRRTNLDDVINDYYNKSLITDTTTATTTATATKGEVVAVSGRHSPQTGFVKSNSSSNSSRSTSPDNNRDTSRPDSPKRSTNLDDVINDYYNKSLITATTTTTATATKDEVFAVSGRHSPQRGFVKSNSSSNSSRSTSPDNNRDTSRPESPKRSTNLDGVINDYYNKSLITATTTATTTATATKGEVVAVSARHSPQTGFVKSNSSSSSSRSTSPDNSSPTSRPGSLKRNRSLDDVIADYYNQKTTVSSTKSETSPSSVVYISPTDSTRSDSKSIDFSDSHTQYPKSDIPGSSMINKSLDDMVKDYYTQTTSTSTFKPDVTTSGHTLTGETSFIMRDSKSGDNPSIFQSQDPDKSSGSASPKRNRSLDDMVSNYYNQTTSPSAVKSELPVISATQSIQIGFKGDRESSDSASSSPSVSNDNSRHGSMPGSLKRNINLDDMINDYYHPSMTATTSTKRGGLPKDSDTHSSQATSHSIHNNPAILESSYYSVSSANTPAYDTTSSKTLYKNENATKITEATVYDRDYSKQTTEVASSERVNMGEDLYFNIPDNEAQGKSSQDPQDESANSSHILPTSAGDVISGSIFGERINIGKKENLFPIVGTDAKIVENLDVNQQISVGEWDSGSLDISANSHSQAQGTGDRETFHTLPDLEDSFNFTSVSEVHPGVSTSFSKRVTDEREVVYNHQTDDREETMSQTSVLSQFGSDVETVDKLHSNNHLLESTSEDSDSSLNAKVWGSEALAPSKDEAPTVTGSSHELHMEEEVKEKDNLDTPTTKESKDFLSVLDNFKIETDITSNFLRRSSRFSGTYSPIRRQSKDLKTDPDADNMGVEMAQVSDILRSNEATNLSDAVLKLNYDQSLVGEVNIEKINTESTHDSTRDNTKQWIDELQFKEISQEQQVHDTASNSHHMSTENALTGKVNGQELYFEDKQPINEYVTSIIHHSIGEINAEGGYAPYYSVDDDASHVYVNDNFHKAITELNKEAIEKDNIAVPDFSIGTKSSNTDVDNDNFRSGTGINAVEDARKDILADTNAEDSDFDATAAEVYPSFGNLSTEKKESKEPNWKDVFVENHNSLVGEQRAGSLEGDDLALGIRNDVNISTYVSGIIQHSFDKIATEGDEREQDVADFSAEVESRHHYVNYRSHEVDAELSTEAVKRDDSLSDVSVDNKTSTADINDNCYQSVREICSTEDDGSNFRIGNELESDLHYLNDATNQSYSAPGTEDTRKDIFGLHVEKELNENNMNDVILDSHNQSIEEIRTEAMADLSLGLGEEQQSIKAYISGIIHNSFDKINTEEERSIHTPDLSVDVEPADIYLNDGFHKVNAGIDTEVVQEEVLPDLRLDQKSIKNDVSYNHYQLVDDLKSTRLHFQPHFGTDASSSEYNVEDVTLEAKVNEPVDQLGTIKTVFDKPYLVDETLGSSHISVNEINAEVSDIADVDRDISVGIHSRDVYVYDRLGHSVVDTGVTDKVDLYPVMDGGSSEDDTNDNFHHSNGDHNKRSVKEENLDPHINVDSGSIDGFHHTFGEAITKEREHLDQEATKEVYINELTAHRVYSEVDEPLLSVGKLREEDFIKRDVNVDLSLETEPKELFIKDELLNNFHPLIDQQNTEAKDHFFNVTSEQQSVTTYATGPYVEENYSQSFEQNNTKGIKTKEEHFFDQQLKTELLIDKDHSILDDSLHQSVNTYNPTVSVGEDVDFGLKVETESTRSKVPAHYRHSSETEVEDITHHITETEMGDINEEIKKLHHILSPKLSDDADNTLAYSTRSSNISMSSTHPRHALTEYRDTTKETAFDSQFFNRSVSFSDLGSHNLSRRDSMDSLTAEDSHLSYGNTDTELQHGPGLVEVTELDKSLHLHSESTQSSRSSFSSINSSMKEHKTNTSDGGFFRTYGETHGQSLSTTESLCVADDSSQSVSNSEQHRPNFRRSSSNELFSKDDQIYVTGEVTKDDYRVDISHRVFLSSDQIIGVSQGDMVEFKPVRQTKKEHITPGHLTLTITQEEDSSKQKEDESHLFSKDKFKALRNVFERGQETDFNETNNYKVQRTSFKSGSDSPSPLHQSSASEDMDKQVSTMFSDKSSTSGNDHSSTHLYLPNSGDMEKDSTLDKKRTKSGTSSGSDSDSDNDLPDKYLPKKGNLQRSLSYDFQTGKLRRDSIKSDSSISSPSGSYNQDAELNVHVGSPVRENESNYSSHPLETVHSKSDIGLQPGSKDYWNSGTFFNRSGKDLEFDHTVRRLSISGDVSSASPNVISKIFSAESHISDQVKVENLGSLKQVGAGSLSERFHDKSGSIDSESSSTGARRRTSNTNSLNSGSSLDSSLEIEDHSLFNHAGPMLVSVTSYPDYTHVKADNTRQTSIEISNKSSADSSRRSSFYTESHNTALSRKSKMTLPEDDNIHIRPNISDNLTQEMKSGLTKQFASENVGMERRQSSSDSEKEAELIGAFLRSNIKSGTHETGSYIVNRSDTSSLENSKQNSERSQSLKTSINKDDKFNRERSESSSTDSDRSTNLDFSRQTSNNHSENGLLEPFGGTNGRDIDLTAAVEEMVSSGNMNNVTSHDELLASVLDISFLHPPPRSSLTTHQDQTRSHTEVTKLQHRDSETPKKDEENSFNTFTNIDNYVTRGKEERYQKSNVDTTPTRKYSHPDEQTGPIIYVDSAARQGNKTILNMKYPDRLTQWNASSYDADLFNQTKATTELHSLVRDSGGYRDTQSSTSAHDYTRTRPVTVKTPGLDSSPIFPSLLSLDSREGKKQTTRDFKNETGDYDHGYFSPRGYNELVSRINTDRARPYSLKSHSDVITHTDNSLNRLPPTSELYTPSFDATNNFFNNSLSSDNRNNSHRETSSSDSNVRLGSDTAYLYRSRDYAPTTTQPDTFADSRTQHHHVDNRLQITPITITATSQAVVGNKAGVHIDLSTNGSFYKPETYSSSSDDESNKKLFIVKTATQKSLNDSRSDAVFTNEEKVPADFSTHQSVSVTGSLSPRLVTDGPTYRVTQSPTTHLSRSFSSDASVTSPRHGEINYSRQDTFEKSLSLARENENGNLYRVRNLSSSIPDGLNDKENQRGRSQTRSHHYSKKSQKSVPRRPHSPERFFKNPTLSLRKEDSENKGYFSDDVDSKQFRTVTKVYLNGDQPKSRSQSAGSRYKISSFQKQASFEKSRSQSGEDNEKVYEVLTVKSSDDPHESSPELSDDSDSGFQGHQQKYRIVETSDSSLDKHRVAAQSSPKLGRNLKQSFEERTNIRPESVSSTNLHRTVIQLGVEGNSFQDNNDPENILDTQYRIKRVTSADDLFNASESLNENNQRSDVEQLWTTGRHQSSERSRNHSSSHAAASDLEREENVDLPSRFVRTMTHEHNNKMYVVNSTVSDPRENHDNFTLPAGWHMSTIDINGHSQDQRISQEIADSQNYRTEKTVYLSKGKLAPSSTGRTNNSVSHDAGLGTKAANLDGQHESHQHFERAERIYEVRSEPRLPEHVHSIEDLSNDLRILRGKILIKNRMDESEHSMDDFDQNVNLFDTSFHLGKDNPMYSSDQDIMASLQREEQEIAKHVHQDITFETVDRIAHSYQAERQVEVSPGPQRKKQNLSGLLLAKLANVDSKDIRQTVDVEHHNEEINGDIHFIHADGERKDSANTYNFDSVNEKVELTLTQGKAYVIIKVIAERIVPTDYEFNIWRKSQAIVTRQIEIDLLANAQRKRLYEHVMSRAGTSAGSLEGGSYSMYHDTDSHSPHEKQLSSMETLKLFSQILDVADGQGDREHTGSHIRQEIGHIPGSAMDIMY